VRFLADENFPRQAVRALRENGFEVRWATGDCPGSADHDILSRCTKDNLILLTLDKDFGELVFRRGLQADCGVILFRVDEEFPEVFADVALAALRSRADWNGFFTVVGGNRIRMRPFDKPGAH